MNYERLSTAVEIMQNICEEINKKSIDNIEYVVLQGLNISDAYASDPFIAYRITEFYNENWLGNVDFMHIPDYNQVAYNCNNYPIIIARTKDSKEIMGISTIKYYENSGETVDPYYPILNEKYFSITGIMTKRNSIYRGIGKKIYEISLRGYYEFNQKYQDTSLTCVIDCRNKNSINAIYAATKNINNNSLLGDSIVSARIIGFYTVTDNDNNMLEAPTIVIRLGENTILDNNRDTVTFFQTKHEYLFKSLLTTLRIFLQEDKISNPIVNIDNDAGIVSYYNVDNPQVLPNVISNGTEEGNDRIPRNPSLIQGPFKLNLIRKRKFGECHEI